MAKKGSKIAVTKGKGIGGSMGGAMEYTRRYKRRKEAVRKQEDEYYASMCGPVTVRKVGE